MYILTVNHLIKPYTILYTTLCTILNKYYTSIYYCYLFLTYSSRYVTCSPFISTSYTCCIALEFDLISFISVDNCTILLLPVLLLPLLFALFRGPLPLLTLASDVAPDADVAPPADMAVEEKSILEGLMILSSFHVN